MHSIDLIILASFVILLAVIAVTTNRLMRSVAGFLSSERCAGRYLLSIAQAMAFISAASFVGGFQQFYKTGLTGFWWMLMGLPVSAGLAMSGWVMYRYRATRALTMPQFLEMRYSRNFRIMAGFLAFIAGVLNCGFFPAITARFVMSFTGMPDLIPHTSIPTYPVFLAALVITPLVLAIAGGQVTIMVTNFFQGIITNIAIIAILFYLLGKFSPDSIFNTLLTAAPEGKSMIHPFKIGELPDFGYSYFLMMIFIRIFTHGVWQGNSGFLSSAKTAHEGRMATMLGEWRNCVSWSFMLIPIIFWGILHNTYYANFATQINDQLAGMDKFEYAEKVVPTGLKLLLPPGLTGLLIIMILGAAVSTDDSAYHSWGTIFLQDAIMPFRKKPFEPKQHILALRLSIIGIGTFAYFFSLLFTLNEYLPMWTFITSSIFIGGAGCAVIGGLYWSRGTTAAAWASLWIGSIFSGGAIIIRQIWDKVPYLANKMAAEDLPNGLKVSFFITLLSAIVYVVVSLLTCKKKHNMDKLLNRGEYAVKEDHTKVEEETEKVSWLARKLGFTKEFSFTDKIIYTAQHCWFWGWIIIFAVGTLINLKFDVPDTSWVIWWKIHLGIFVALALIVTIWYTIGGTINMVDLVKTLTTKEVDDSDDGTVVHSADDELDT